MDKILETKLHLILQEPIIFIQFYYQLNLLPLAGPGSTKWGTLVDILK